MMMPPTTHVTISHRSNPIGIPTRTMIKQSGMNVYVNYTSTCSYASYESQGEQRTGVLGWGRLHPLLLECPFPAVLPSGFGHGHGTTPGPSLRYEYCICSVTHSSDRIHCKQCEACVIRRERMLCKMHNAATPVRCNQRASTVLLYSYSTILYRYLSTLRRHTPLCPPADPSWPS